MVREHIDTIDALLARYVAGTLPRPAHVLVSAHMEMKPQALRFSEDLTALAGASLELIEPAGLEDRDAGLERIFGAHAGAADDATLAASTPSAAGMPASLRAFLGYDLDDIPWRTKLPGFREYDLGEIDGCHASMFWIRPGRAVPAHTHQGCEISLVLSGAFSDGIGRYGPGDISVADDEIDHRPVAENEVPCIGFAVTDAPLKMTGSFRQLIGDLIG